MKVKLEDYKEIERIFDNVDCVMKVGDKSNNNSKLQKDYKEFVLSLMYMCRKSVLSEMEVV